MDVQGAFRDLRPAAGHLIHRCNILLITLKRLQPCTGLCGVAFDARQRLPCVCELVLHAYRIERWTERFSSESSTENRPASMTLTVAAMPHAKATRLCSLRSPGQVSLVLSVTCTR